GPPSRASERLTRAAPRASRAASPALERNDPCSPARSGRERADGASMKISILTYLERESNQRSHDVVVDQVARALHAAGHEPVVLGVHADVRVLLQRLEQQAPDLVFHLLEDFGELPYGPSDVAGLLDLTGVPYTGGGPGELFIQQDKALAKKILAF